MQLAVEITLYPLQQDYVEHIRAFIERLNEDKALIVKTTHTCTLLSGEYEYVMTTLTREFKRTYDEVGQAAFVCKFLNADNMDLS